MFTYLCSLRQFAGCALRCNFWCGLLVDARCFAYIGKNYASVALGRKIGARQCGPAESAKRVGKSSRFEEVTGPKQNPQQVATTYG